MNVDRSEFGVPVACDMEMMELHVGVVAPLGEPAPRAVTVFVQAVDALITDHKAGALLHDWVDVLQFVTGVLQAAHEAWPEPAAKAQPGARCIKPQCPPDCSQCNYAIPTGDAPRMLIADLLNAFAVDGFEAPLEDGESELVDRARAFLRRAP